MNKLAALLATLTLSGCFWVTTKSEGETLQKRVKGKKRSTPRQHGPAQVGGLSVQGQAG